MAAQVLQQLWDIFILYFSVYIFKDYLYISAHSSEGKQISRWLFEHANNSKYNNVHELEKEYSIRTPGQIRLFILCEYFTRWKTFFTRGRDRLNLINSFGSET